MTETGPLRMAAEKALNTPSGILRAKALDVLTLTASHREAVALLTEALPEIDRLNLDLYDRIEAFLAAQSGRTAPPTQG